MTYLLRSSAVLTTSYDYSEAVECSLRNQLNLYIDTTIGSLTSIEVVVEFSNDKTNWFSETFQAVSAGVETDSVGNHAWTTTGKRRLFIPIADKYFRVGIKGTGTVTNSLASIIANIATV